MKRSALFRSPAAGLALLACGCAATAPAPTGEILGVDIPDSWSGSRPGQAGVDADWLRRFRDPVLEDLELEALRSNPDLRAAQARVERAAAAARIAGSDLSPQIDAGFQAIRSKRNFIGFPFDGAGGTGETFSTIFNTYGVSLDVLWEIDVWGRIRAGRQAALQELEASEADFQAARVSLAAQVAKAWFALTEANQQLALAHDTLENFRSTEQVIRERFESGESEGDTAAQLRLAKSDSASAQAQVEERGEQRDAALRQLEILVGRYPEGTLASSETMPDMPEPPPAGLPSELLQRRPDLLAAERRFAASFQRVREARLAFFPRLAITGNGGSSTDDLGSLLDSDFGIWSLAGNVTQPILQGGRLLAQKDLRSAEYAEALALLQGAVLQAFLEVETALQAEFYLQRREAALAESVDMASEADTEARANYRNGVGDILTVFTSQVRLLRSRADLISVRRLRLENRVNLHLALGGDFTAASAGVPSS